MKAVIAFFRSEILHCMAVSPNELFLNCSKYRHLNELLSAQWSARHIKMSEEGSVII